LEQFGTPDSSNADSSVPANTRGVVGQALKQLGRRATWPMPASLSRRTRRATPLDKFSASAAKT
jgi:hypothetical protein